VIEKASQPTTLQSSQVKAESPQEEDTVDAEESPFVRPSATFAALALDDDDDDDDSDSDSDSDNNAQKEGKDDATQSNGVDLPRENNLLADLAREREIRAKEKGTPTQPGPPSKSKNKKNKKGKKLGGNKAASKQSQEGVVEGLDEMDDLAFLDNQIQKVQTSHGRKVEGTGSNYRTLINGVLISKPAPKEKPKDTRAANALQAKLKAAEGGRKAKPKPKKKK
jgi:hypothetical protein